MLQSFKSAFLLMAIEFILMNGLEFAQKYTEENEAAVEKAIKDLLPGEDFDALGWGIVKSLLPKIFEIAATLIDKIDGTESHVERHALMIKAIRGITV
jgi:prophage maintenance system killer protein